MTTTEERPLAADPVGAPILDELPPAPTDPEIRMGLGDLRPSALRRARRSRAPVCSSWAYRTGDLTAGPRQAAAGIPGCVDGQLDR